MKRALSLLLTFVILLGLCPVVALAAGPAITAEANVTEAKIGDTVEVAYTLSDNPGFTNIELTLDFDEDVLQFTGLKINEDTETYEGRFGGGLTVANTDPYSDKYGFITNARDKATTTDGKLFVAVFKVLAPGSVTAGATVSHMANSGAAVTAPAVTPTGTITIAGVPATGITLNKTELSLEAGSTYLLSPTVTPDNTTDKIVWSSSDEKVATVSTTGYVTAVSAGTATITATAGEVSATCAVAVTKEESIVGKSANGYSERTYATVTGIKSVTVGSATKTVKNIYKLPLTGHEETYLHVDGSSTGGVGYALDGTAVVGSQWGTDMSSQGLNFSWADIFTKNLLVSEADLTAAVGEENVSKLGLSDDKIYAFLYVDDGMAGRNCGILFEITPVLATGLEITETLTLDKGATGKISATVTPSGSSAEITWSSSDESIATVDANGTVTAVGAGTATITATAVQGETTLTDTCTVTVVTAFTISDIPSNGDDWGGYIESIVVSGVESLGHAWNDKNLSIFVAADTNASVTLKFNGGGWNAFTDTVSTTITNGAGTYSGSHAQDNWTVNFLQPVPATGISLNKNETEILVGNNETLTATVEPSNSTDVVTWTSSDTSIATVSSSGKVTGKAEGQATITAKAGSMTAECTVTVKRVAATGITISADGLENGKLSLLKGNKITLTAVLTPEDTTDIVSWTSSDTSVATVNSSGRVTAVAAGEATITATAGGVSAECTVTVPEIHSYTENLPTLPKPSYYDRPMLNSISITGAEVVSMSWEEYAEEATELVCNVVLAKDTADGTAVKAFANYNGYYITNREASGSTALSEGQGTATVTLSAWSITTTNLVFNFTVEPEAVIEVELDKDYYTEGDTVTAKVYLTSENDVNSMGYSLTYDPDLMVLKAAAEAEGVGAARTDSDKDAGTLARSLFVIPESSLTAGEDGRILIDTLSFTMLKDGELEIGLAPIEGDVDFAEKSVYALEDGDHLNTKGLVIYLANWDEDQAAAAAVDALIEAIGTVDATKGDEIEAARTAYDALTQEQKALVTGLETLEAAEEQFDIWKKGDVNYDGVINAVDLSMLLSAYGTDSVQCDITCDGTVAAEDLSILLSNYGLTIQK